MFKQFIHDVAGADGFMIGSLLLFLLFFVLVGVYLFLVDAAHVRRMSQLPLDEPQPAP
jgi:hypothetical protein